MWHICDQITVHHLIIMVTVRAMSPADTPTADAKAMNLRRPASGRIMEIIGVTRNEEKGLAEGRRVNA